MNFKESGVFDKENYEGLPSTLCLGCGHDQISKHIIKAFYSSSVNPFSIAKISGIGCSSKTPNYFLKQSRGFNTIHGRMASVATGVKIANRKLKVLGVSGDGDTGSIGLGSFLHTVRKNVPMIYIVENNGVYGLTKGQLSATAEKDSSLKNREGSPFYTMDLCRMALSAGCGFIARSFSGDNKQLTQILKAALSYDGFAFIDVISPCVVYGSDQEFPHSFSFMKKNKFPLHDLDIIAEQPAVSKEIPEGEVQQIPLPNGNTLILRKLKDKSYNPSEKNQAWRILNSDSGKQELVTGLIYYREQDNFLKKMELCEKALVDMGDEEIRLESQNLEKILKAYQ